MISDVARPYLNASSLTPTCVEIRDTDFEQGDEDMCGELLVSMCGTRPAAQTLAEVLRQVVDIQWVSSHPRIHLGHAPRGESPLLDRPW